jgi:hypothetical protein
MAGLLVLLVGAVVLSPTGSVSLTISPAGLSLGSRIALGVVGLVAACLPPAALTYAWYVARLRAWGRVADVEQGRQLEGGLPEAPTVRPADRVRVHRRDGSA